MIGNLFQHVYNGPDGALTGDPRRQFTLYKPATLIHVSFCCSSATAATLDLGDSGDPNGIISDGAIGQSGTPAEFGPALFDGDLCDQLSGYHFDVDDLIVDYEITHASAEDVCLVLTFLEG